MSKLNQVICDVCNKPIESGSIIFHQYKVKITSVELATDFCKKRKLDMCPNCMKEFKDFVATKKLFEEV